MRVGPPPKPVGTGDRPDLSVVLDYYGVRHNPTRMGEQMVRCPIQDQDKTPSLSLRLGAADGKGLMNCHSCRFEGDVWNLIQEKEGINYRRAREFSAAHGWTAPDGGGGGSELRAVPQRGHRSVSGGPRARTDSRDGRAVPRWARSRS